MKKWIIFPFLLLVVSSGIAQNKKFKDIVGTWEIGGEQSASLQIIDSSNIILTYMGEQKKITNYTIDFSKSPIWFDFTTSVGGEVVKVKSLLAVVGEEVIKWQLFIDDDRTAHFSSSKGELFYLKRSRPAAVVASN